MNIRKAMADLLAKTSKDVDTLMGDAELVKATDGLREIKDQWDEGNKHTAISGAEVGTGIPLAAMGSNTERMNRNYASPAPQNGPALDAEKLLANLGMMSAAMKSGFDRQGAAIDILIAQQKSTNAFITALLKAEDDEEAAKAAAVAAAKAEPEDEMAEKAKSTATDLLAKAASFLSRAKALMKAADEMDDDDDKDAIKAAKAKSRVLRKAAGIALSKARRSAYIAGDAALKKAVTDAALKGEVDWMDDEELDKAEGCSDDDVEKALAAVTAKKAAPATTEKADDKGNQGDRQDPSNGDQIGAAAKAQLDAALQGIAALTSTVNGIIDMVGGQSKAQPLQLAKAVVLPGSGSMLLRISEALDAGAITPAQAIEAESLANGLDAVEKGNLPKTAWQDRLKTTSASVRALYADAA